MALPFASSTDSPNVPAFATATRLRFAAASITAFMLLPGCSDPYSAIVGNCHDPSPVRSTALSCDGNSVVETQYRNGNDHARCEATELSRKACLQPAACLAWSDTAAACSFVCTTNSDCRSTQYCSEGPSLDGRHACFNYVSEGADCAGDTTHCAPGTSCLPQYPLSDAGADAGADADAAPESPYPTGYACEKP